MRGNNFEAAVQRELSKRGMFFEVERKDLMGTPDIVFPIDRIVVFLDGCFWHGCTMHRGRPRKLTQWEDTWYASQARDRAVSKKLQDEGWVVLRFWEHDSIKEIGTEIQSIRELRNRTQKRPS